MSRSAQMTRLFTPEPRDVRVRRYLHRTPQPIVVGRNHYSVTIAGDVPDDDQARLRLRGLFPSGHVAMSATGDTRSGSCDTTFDVFGESPEAAHALAEGELGAWRIVAVQLVC